jgi:NADPH-dependent glutamate synthase beta subunit-like oxidoreductase
MTNETEARALCERLRKLNRQHPDADVMPFKEAADTIEALLAEIADLYRDIGIKRKKLEDADKAKVVAWLEAQSCSI